MYLLKKNLVLYYWAWIRQTEYIPVVMMTKGGPTKIVNSMTPGAGFCVLQRGHL